LPIDHLEDLLGAPPLPGGDEDLDEGGIAVRPHARSEIRGELELADQELLESARATSEQHLQEQRHRDVIRVPEGRALVADGELLGGGRLDDLEATLLLL